MEHRDRIVYGTRFHVPQNIVRLQEGWQVRYGEWKLFTDPTKDISGARQSLRNAKAALIRRIKSLPAPSGLRKAILSSKKFKNLPVEISGPRKYKRKGRRFSELTFQVTLPQCGGKPKTKAFYIGTDYTVTEKRIDAALQKAKDIRNKCEEDFRRAVTEEKRKNI
jgi:hypothetical protein